MERVYRSELAEADLREIWDYIALDSPESADRLLLEIDEKLKLYVEHPKMGTLREEFAKGVRSFPVGSYLVFYKEATDGIELIRVLHGMRDLKELMAREIRRFPPSRN